MGTGVPAGFKPQWALDEGTAMHALDAAAAAGDAPAAQLAWAHLELAVLPQGARAIKGWGRGPKRRVRRARMHSTRARGDGVMRASGAGTSLLGRQGCALSELSDRRRPSATTRAPGPSRMRPALRAARARRPGAPPRTLRALTCASGGSARSEGAARARGARSPCAQPAAGGRRGGRRARPGRGGGARAGRRAVRADARRAPGDGARACQGGRPQVPPRRRAPDLPRITVPLGLRGGAAWARGRPR